MVGEWVTASLGELCDFRAGSAFKPSLQGQPSGAFPFVKVSDMNLPANAVRIQDANNWVTEDNLRELRAKPFPPGTVIFAKIGEALRQNRLRQLARETIVDNNMMGAVPRTDRVDPRFFYYALSQFDFSEIAQGTALPYLTISSLSALELKVPPADQQRAIAHILGTLDDKIELNRQMSETLEAVARAMFKSWFVDFEPVHAKAQGRDPDLPKQIADLFPDSFDHSALGDIPKGWELKPLTDVLSELETGGRPKGGISDYATGTPSVGAESIVGLGVFDYSKTKYVPNEFFEKMTKGRIKSRDVLLYKDGGRPGEFEPHVTLFGDGFPFDRCAINEHVYRIRVNQEIGQNFLLFWLSSDAVMEEMRIKGTGVAIPGLNSSQVKSLTMLMPTIEVAKAFDALVDPGITRILAACNESRTLSILRDALLPMLVSGELGVKDAERLTAELPT